MIDALALLRRYADRPNVRYYAAGENVPLDGIVPADWRTAVVDEREDGGTRVERIPYELCVLAALREAIRRREVWVVGAVRWRNPEVDLPTDFDAHRAGHYKRLGQPLDPTEFITDAPRANCPPRSVISTPRWAAHDTGGVSIGTRAGQPWITVPKLAKQPEPANLERLKAAVQTRWGTVDLLDILAEADHHVGLVDCFPSIATRESTPAGLLRERLLLVLFALGTNTGHQASGHRRPRARARPRCATCAACSSPARICAGRSRHWSTPTIAARDAGAVGRRHSVRLGLEEVRRLGLEPDDRVARPLRRPRRDDLLARRAKSRRASTRSSRPARPPRSPR